MMTVNVLGTKYTIKECNRLEDPNLEKVDGYCDTSVKTIVINTFKDSPDSLEDFESYRNKVIRHELVHAFLFESGMDCCSWADNEEIVDWIALQFPKLQVTFELCNVV